MANNAISFDKCITSGHGGFPPTVINATQNLLFLDGKAAVISGDKITVHCDSDLCHDGLVQATTSLIFIDGIPVGKIGDPISCGDTVAQGSIILFGE